MTKLRVLFFLVSLVAVAAGVGTPVFAQTQTTGKKAQDMAGIEKFHTKEIAATLSRDTVALTDLWTDDAVRLIQGRPTEVGRKAIRESNERWSALPGVKVLSYVPETKDLVILGGWAVEWGYITGSYVPSTGGEAKQINGTRLMILEKMRDGSWKCFRGMGGPTFTEPWRGEAVQVPAEPAGRTIGGSATDQAAMKKLRELDISWTLSLNTMALTNSWTDDAVRIDPVPPAVVGKQAIGAFYESLAANKDFKILSYVPDYKEFVLLDGGWAVGWRPYTVSFITSPGGAPVDLRGRVLCVYKKMPDGSWKGFRMAGITD